MKQSVVKGTNCHPRTLFTCELTLVDNGQAPPTQETPPPNPVLDHHPCLSPVLFLHCACIYIYRGCRFSTDPQQTDKSRPIQVLSDWLETSVGHYSSWALFAVLPVVAVYFDVVGRIEVGIKMAAMGHVFLELGMGVIFWACGNSFKRVLDESLRRNSVRTAAKGAPPTADRGSKDKLLVVRKKATRTTFFIVQQVCGNDATRRY